MQIAKCKIIENAMSIGLKECKVQNEKCKVIKTLRREASEGKELPTAN
jgi:hypothetical protein